MHNILLFGATHSYLDMSLEKHLTEIGYDVINIESTLQEIKNIKSKISAIVIFVDPDLLYKVQSINLLKDKAI